MTNVYSSHQQQESIQNAVATPDSEKLGAAPAEDPQPKGTSHQEILNYTSQLIEIYANALDSIFQTKSDPNSKMISTRAFIETILKKSQSTYSIVQTSLFYLFRVKKIVKRIICREPKSKLESMMCCGRRMFLASLMTASKYLQDKNYRNSAWCKITNLELKEINQLEIAFLKMIDYNLYISKPTFDMWYNKLRQHIQSKTPTIVINNKHQITNVKNEQQHNTLASPPASPIIDTRSGMPSPPQDIVYTMKRHLDDQDHFMTKKQCI